ncbi:hypothetical protein C8F01DRAFT_128113 [Mycena amicta]|nr:hypothetical protein C8F01DRAFT_128113 [Mycena amicta]
MPSVSVSPPTSSTTSSSSSSTTTNPPSSTSSTTLIQIVIVVVCGVLLLCLIMFIIFRRRQNKKQIRKAQAPMRKEPEVQVQVQAGEIVSRTHPAALMITAADGKGTPRFVHTPGTNMRTATRRADGAWEFSDPRAPFAPSIIADASERPSSSYSRSPSPGNNGSSSQQLLTAPSASPWGPPTPASEAWRGIYSPAPSTAASTFLPYSSSARNSTVSSNESFVDMDMESASSSSSNPFRSPVASPTPSPTPRAQPSAPSPASSQTFLEPPTPTPRSAGVESRAAREIRLGYEALDRERARAAQPSTSTTLSTPSRRPLPSPSLSPAARAKEAESRAARAIRQGYENVDRYSEYAEPDEALPAY